MRTQQTAATGELSGNREQFYILYNTSEFGHLVYVSATPSYQGVSGWVSNRADATPMTYKEACRLAFYIAHHHGTVARRLTTRG